MKHQSNPLVLLSAAFAIAAHTACKQVRKYTGEAYINHPLAVANTVASVEGVTPEMIAAAQLHDVVEDCNIPLSMLEEMFGPIVAGLVSECSHVDRTGDPRKLNRFERMAIELARAADISPAAQTIKLADLIDNTSTIVKHDPKFAEVYMAEKRRLLLVLVDGDTGLWHRAANIVNEYYGVPPVDAEPTVFDISFQPKATPADPNPWYPAGLKPSESGVYERRFDFRDGRDLPVFAKFDGSKWRSYSDSVVSAGVETSISAFQDEGDWRLVKA
jgi:guanosine-3',5'-bis(diphosphate) 3'-pyrophosphohydrolase